MIFVCGIDEDFNITEEMPALVLLKGTKKVSNLLESAAGNLDQVGMNSTNMSGVTINGAAGNLDQVGINSTNMSGVTINGASAVVGR